MKIKKYIAEIIKKYIDIDRNEIEEMIEVPPSLEMGDYSLQCFKLSNILNKSPDIIAKEIKLSLDNNNFEKVEIVGGYLNFFLNKSFVLENTLMEIISENNIANNSQIKNNKVICIDYSYCNKCDKMEFGELFTALIGNSLYKLLKKQGYLVYRIRTLRDNNYKNKESEDIYKLFNIGFDINIDSSVYKSKIEYEIKKLKFKGLIEYRNNISVITLKKYNMAPIVLDNNKTKLSQMEYVANTIYLKEGYDFYKYIYVVESTKKTYFNQVFKLLELTNYKWINQCIQINSGLVKFNNTKLLKRKEESSVVKKLVDEIIDLLIKNLQSKNLKIKNIEEIRKLAIGSIIFTYLKDSKSKNVFIDLDGIISESKETLLYIQYTYSKANKILSESKHIQSEVDFNKLNSKDEFELASILGQFDNVINYAIEQLEPSIITKYLIEVVNKFNVFYKSYEVLNLEDKSLIKARLTLIDATSRIIKSTLEILGIENVELYD